MADPGAEARIRDLKRRLELEPGSRLFVSLAEEYRKTGRVAEALSTLQKGLLAHPNYLSARVALGRTYLEAGQITEALATFSKVLAADPCNLVSAKSLADIHFSRGDSVEAIKKYKLYRALSGDRSVDGAIEHLEVELAPPPPPASKEDVPPPPPPTFFEEGPTGPIRRTLETGLGEPIAPPTLKDLDDTSVEFEPDESRPGPRRHVGPEPVPLSRDLPLTAPEPAAAMSALLSAGAGGSDSITAVAPVEEAAPEAAVASAAEQVRFETATGDEARPPEPEAAPSGRVLADLYFAQRHYAEALAIYDDLAAASPHDQELRRLRREAEARLLPAAAAPPAATVTPDRALGRRLAKIRALKRWLSVVQTG